MGLALPSRPLSWPLPGILLLLLFGMISSACAEGLCRSSLTAPPDWQGLQEFVQKNYVRALQGVAARAPAEFQTAHPQYKFKYLELLAKALEPVTKDFPSLQLRWSGMQSDPYLIIGIQRTLRVQDYLMLQKESSANQNFRYTAWSEDVDGHITVWQYDEPMLLDEANEGVPLFQRIFGSAVFPARPVIPEWKLNIRGPSIYAVREEVRKLAENIAADLKEAAFPASDEYVLTSGGRPEDLYRWELRLQFTYDEQQRFQSALVETVRIPVNDKNPTPYLNFGTQRYTSLADLQIGYGQQLGHFLQYIKAPQNIAGQFPESAKVGLAFRDYHKIDERYTWGIVRRRPLTVAHGQNKILVNAVAKSPSNKEIKGMMRAHIPRQFFDLVARHDRWARVAKKVLPQLNGRYVQEGNRRHAEQFLGKVDDLEGNGRYFLLEDGLAGSPSRLFVFKTRLGFVVDLAEVKVANPITYIGEQMREVGAAQPMASIRQKRNYIANLIYPAQKNLASLRTAVLDYAHDHYIDLKEVGSSVDPSCFTFDLAIEDPSKGWAKFQERFTIRYQEPPGDLANKRLGYSIQRQLLYNNPLTHEENLTLELPFIQHPDSHDLTSWDGVFEEVGQILGDFVAAQDS